MERNVWRQSEGNLKHQLAETQDELNSQNMTGAKLKAQVSGLEGQVRELALGAGAYTRSRDS
jgi:hypothetical protein